MSGQEPEEATMWTLLLCITSELAERLLVQSVLKEGIIIICNIYNMARKKIKKKTIL